VDEILANFPAIGSPPRLEGAIAFINAHPQEIEACLAAGAQAWEEARKLNPQEPADRVSRKARDAHQIYEVKSCGSLEGS
jgi:hypothetical protein